MKKPLDVLQREYDTKGQEAKALLEATQRKCDAEGNRLMTAEERGAVQTLADQALAIKAQIDGQQSEADMRGAIDRLVAGGSPAPARPQRRLGSLGDQFVGSTEYREFFGRHQHRVSSAWRSPVVEVFTPQMFAATLTEDPASGGALVTPDVQTGIRPMPPAPLVVADLFAPGSTSSNAVSYMQETAFTNAAAPVAEGQPKPESALVFAAVTDPVRKIAHWLPVTEEMLEDVPQIRSYIDSRLIIGVQMAEDDQLLNGDGIAPNILGIRNRPGLAADYALVTGQSNADAMLGQTLAIFSSSYLMPTGYVMNPQDWAATLMTKDGNGQYYTGGPFSPIQSATLWGLPVALTPAQPQHTGLVGAFKTGAQIFRRGGIRVEASNSHQDFFVKNLVAIRAEERLALAVYRPGAFGEVTGLTPATP